MRKWKTIRLRKRGWQAAGRRPRRLQGGGPAGCREEAAQAAGSGEERSLSDSRPLPPGTRSRAASPWQTVNTPEPSLCDPWEMRGHFLLVNWKKPPV